MDTQSANQEEKESNGDFDFFKQYTKEQKIIAKEKDKKNKLENNVVIGISLILLGFIFLTIAMTPSSTEDVKDTPTSLSVHDTERDAKSSVSIQAVETTKDKAAEIPPVNIQAEQINQTIKGLESIGQQLNETKIESEKSQLEINKNGGIKVTK